jgi:hypothetical protein
MNFNWVALASLFSLGVYGLVENVEPISPRTTKVSVDAYLDKDFYFGYASAAAQNEGAVDVDGKSKSQWDVFAETPGRIFNMEKPNDTIDEYFNYKVFDQSIFIFRKLSSC